ncbi:MAG TPA: DUF4157 domain-containing protein [Streptosporangiaceae bacterium]|nr:DUF4157 domain-containing protein [Streptosporangiaceae bacterium]
MAADVAPADAEKKPAADSRPKAAEDMHDGTAAASTMPAVQRCPGASLGERQVQAQAAPGNTRVGAAGDAAERNADMAADHVMRQMDASPAAPAPPSPAPLPAAPAPAEPVRRAEDPAAEQRLPGTETAKPATPAATPAPGAGPETATPAGPAPLIAPPDAAGARPAETGTPAPDAEPPAPEGEAPARETPQVPDDVQEYLDASRGKGAPLPDATLRAFEDKFQRPFDDVRIHDDSGADDAARKIDALAFTRGNDIYFRSGAYDPASQPGKKLLAHELAHVVQQRPGVNRKPAPGLGGAVVRRAKASGTKPSGAKPGKVPEGLISGTTITIAELPVPDFKKEISGGGPYTMRKGTREENPTKQASVWRAKAKAKVPDSVAKRIKDLKKPDTPKSDEAHYLRLGNLDYFLIGTESSIANQIRVPAWDKKGNLHSFDIDHRLEAQLGGEDEKPEGNLWLLDSVKNRYAGPAIMGSINETLHDFLANEKVKPGASSSVPSVPEVRDAAKGWTVIFKELVPSGGPKLAEEDTWQLDDLGAEKDLLLSGFKFATEKEKTRLSGSPTKLSIFDRPSGGGLREIARTGDETEIKDVKEWDTDLFKLTTVFFKEDDKGKGTGRLEGTAFKETPGSPIHKAPLKIPLKKLPGVEWGGVAAPGAIDYWRARAFSPINFPEPEFDVKKGIVGRGIIAKPDIKLLENVEFAVVLDGDVRIEATVMGGELSLPGPFKVTGGSVTLLAGMSGIGVTGDIQFEIEKLAKGHIGAGAGVGKGSPTLWLDGGLNFDTKMFTKAQLGLSYRDGKWGVKGELEVGPGKVKGIKRASAKVEVQDDTVTATGEFESSLKGVDKGTLGFRYNPATGMEITGQIVLGQGIPGIKSGKLDATIKEGPDGHSLSGGVTLEPSVPGLTGTVTGHYADGAFCVQADLGYEKGLAKGKVDVGLTNQAVGEDGRPAGPPQPDGSITAFGTGLVTLTLTPWLTGTVGLKLTPTGEIEVSGEVALPSEFQVFGPLPLDKELFSVDLDIPIVGVSVAGVHVGIFATVGGGASISAGVGPGVLRGVALKVTYNPGRPEDTTVTGTGTFAVPAHASLRLTVGGGVGAGIPLVDATAKLNAHGEIGVAGEASASVQVNWAPPTGIVLDAHGDIFVEPRFKFGLDASVKVTVGVWRLKKTLYSHTWCLADFEFGSGLRFGLSLPIHYESMKPFDIAFDQIQWTYPQINPKDLLGDLMEQLVSGPAQTAEC